VTHEYYYVLKNIIYVKCYINTHRIFCDKISAQVNRRYLLSVVFVEDPMLWDKINW